MLTNLKELTIGLIGLGNMNSAILQGLLNAHLKVENLWGVASSAQSAQKKTDDCGIRVYAPAEYASQLAQTDILILGVKPHKTAEALAALKQQLGKQSLKKDCVLISVAAGVKLETLEHQLGVTLPMLRAMPNLAVSVGQGVTALSSNAHVTPAQEQRVCDLFNALGKSALLPESLLNVATGLVGSGPAYILLFIEALIDSAVHAGMPRATAKQLVPQLLTGTAALLEQSNLHPAQLRDNVVTPAGTTAEGLAVLEASGFRAMIDEALQASIARAKALG